MGLEKHSTWLRWARYASVLCCLLAFSLPNLHQAGLAWNESAERECPCQEQEATNAQQLVVLSSSRRCSRVQHNREFYRSYECGARPAALVFSGSRLPVIVSHQLPNGLRAPLLI